MPSQFIDRAFAVLSDPEVTGQRADASPGAPGPERQKLRLRPAGRPGDGPATGDEAWQVLVVDDEPEVHDLTRMVLRHSEFQGRPFAVLSAFSAAEARAILTATPDIPVMLLDVVMEAPDAGLNLVRQVREELGNHAIRVILRTGQAGDAPERTVMLAYDVNDFRNKAELTAQQLFTAVVSALRSWRYVSTLERLNNQLEARVEARTKELAEAHNFIQQIVEWVPTPLWFKDADGRFRLYNQAFRDLFGIDAGAWKERRLEEVMPGEFAKVDAMSDQLLQSGETNATRHEAPVTVGERVCTLLISKKSIPGADGKSNGIVGAITDVSYRECKERELQQLVTTDPLTGSFSRRHFLELAKAEWDRVLQHGRKLSIIFLDIDHFKWVNDTFGHAAGDEALQSIGRVCRQTLRDSDLLGRLGGEEFAVLLPDTGLARATEVAKRLRRAVRALFVRETRITASFGVVEYTSGDGSLDALLARADQAMYRVKRSGRDGIATGEAIQVCEQGEG